ncbi:MAG: protein translocase subunit SecF [Nanoarchaeota archaeon]
MKNKLVHFKNNLLNKVKHIYETKYKILMLITFTILVLALVQIGLQYALTGDFVNKGITLKGGSTITIIKTDINTVELDSFLKDQFSNSEISDISVRTITSAGKTTSIAIDSAAQEEEQINALLDAVIKKEGLSKEDYSVEVMGASLGDSFFRQTMVAIAIAFLLMCLVVFAYFRSPAPSLMVIFCAFSDIVVPLAIFNLTGMKLSTAGIAAFLMLIGYSIDTDMLLTARVLKRKEGSMMDRVYGAIKTGLTMTGTTISAVVVALIFVQSEVIKQIMFILFIGLLTDIVMTWIQNVGLLRWYLEGKERLK